jgi:hypothetical protein
MAVITSYATLQTEIGNTLARSDLTAEIPQFIQFAENRLYRSLNLRNEETALSVAISGGVAAVPSDFKALKFAYYDQSPAALLDWVPIEQLYREYPTRTESGIPSVISREATNFVFGPVASDGTLKGVYYAKQDPLRTTDPSWYVTNAPEVLLYGSLLEAAPFIQDDERLQVWGQMYQSAVDTLLTEERHSHYSKGHLVQKAS